MSGINYLADTNAVLYFLSGKECMKPFVSSRFAVSVINELELLSFPKITDEEERQIRGFIEKSVVLDLEDRIKERTIQLRRAYNVKLPDAIVAATAIEHEMMLITADIGFERIKELKLKLIIP